MASSFGASSSVWAAESSAGVSSVFSALSSAGASSVASSSSSFLVAFLTTFLAAFLGAAFFFWATDYVTEALAFSAVAPISERDPGARANLLSFPIKLLMKVWVSSALI